MAYRAYTPEQVRDAIIKSYSLAGSLRCLGLKPCGGNYQTIKKYIHELRLDVSHFTYSNWNKGRYFSVDRYRNVGLLRAALIRLHGQQCWRCRNTEWQGSPIPLELEHVDGDRTNNDLANLSLLCCNCHALTSTWRRRKSSLRPR